jgi:hypothetical protein
VTAEQWAYAELLGKARTLSNPERADDADRGEEINEKVDLQGALGELMLYGIVRDLPDSTEAARQMLAHMFCATGGKDVKGADLVFEEEGRTIGVDVKSFDCSPWKRYLAINDNKHHKLYGQCIGYLAIICPSYARTACLTRLIPYDDVSAWECFILGKKRSPSRNLRIDVAMRTYSPANYSLAASRRDVHSPDEVRRLARQTSERSPLVNLCRLLPAAEKYLIEAQKVL